MKAGQGRETIAAKRKEYAEMDCVVKLPDLNAQKMFERTML